MLHELLLTLSGYPGGVFVEEARTGIVKVRIWVAMRLDTRCHTMTVHTELETSTSRPLKTPKKKKKKIGVT